MLVYQIWLKDSKNNENALKLFDTNDKKIDITNINYNPFEHLLFHKNLKFYCVPFGIMNQLYPSTDNLENYQKSLLVIKFISFISMFYIFILFYIIIV